MSDVKTFNILAVKYYDAGYETFSYEELCKAPISAIRGISESDAAAMKKAFGIDNVRELAENKYILIAQAIDLFSKYSAKILDKEFESKDFEDLRKKPPSAISGVSEKDGELLKKAFGIDTIEELANNKYVRIAQITNLVASVEKLL